MIFKKRKLSCKTLLLSLGVLFFSQLSFTQTTYKFGVVPQFEPRKLAAIWVPILKHLEVKTGFKFELVGSADIPEFESGYETGRFDLAYLNPYHALIARKTQKYQPILKEGNSKLFGILVVAKNGSIKKVRDLKQKNKVDIAFPAPNSLGASLLMRSDLDRKFGIKFNPIWTKTHTSAYLSVVLGKATAAGGIMATLKQEPLEVQEKLKVIYETKPISPHPIVVHPRVSKKDQEIIQKAFLELASTPEGVDLLSLIPIKKLVSTSFEDYKELSKLGLEKYYIKGSD